MKELAQVTGVDAESVRKYNHGRNELLSQGLGEVLHNARRSGS